MGKRTYRVWGLLALPCALASCSDQQAGLSRSGGDASTVELVDAASPLWRHTEGWRLSAGPILRIGSVENSSFQLDRVAGSIRLEDGRIVVADAGAASLWFFGPEGRYLGKSGRRGRGPGEFYGIGGLGRLAGDSVLVWDRGSTRASIFDTAGRFVRSVQPTGLNALPSFVGALENGEFLVTGGSSRAQMKGPSGSEQRDTVVLLRFDRDGRLRDTVGRFAGPEMYLDISHGLVTREGVIFGRNTSFAVGRDRVFAAETGHYEIVESDLSGSTVRKIRRNVEPQRASPDDVQQYRKFLLDRNLAGTPGAFRMSAARRVHALPHRNTLPVLDAMKVDVDGNLWVEHFRAPGSRSGEWDVFSPGGKWLGTVQTPEGFQITEIGRDYVLGVAISDLEVEEVRLYQLIRTD